MRNQFTRAASLLTYVVFMALSLAACTKKATTSGLQSDSSKTSRGKHTDAIDQMSGNPVLPVPTADPDIIYANGKYYIYTTATGPNASQFHAYSSTDLLNWTDEGIFYMIIIITIIINRVHQVISAVPFKDIRGLKIIRWLIVPPGTC